MGKKVTNVEEQIRLLESRGMNFDYSNDKVKEILLDIGYYRLGFYWKPFEIDDRHNFKKGTNFSSIVQLYYFDSNLRNILTKYINRIEINFRTKVVYYVSNKYKESPTWFADKKIVNENITNNLTKFYNDKFVKLNKPIQRHHHRYINDKYAPAWKTLEFFTFGIILNIYRNLKEDDIKKQISNSFEIERVKKFTNFLETIVLIRNLCAHGDVLFDFKTPKGISVIPHIKLNNDRNSIGSCIKVIDYFLGVISKNRSNDMKNEVQQLFENIKQNKVVVDIIKKTMNYF